MKTLILFLTILMAGNVMAEEAKPAISAYFLSLNQCVTTIAYTDIVDKPVKVFPDSPATPATCVVDENTPNKMLCIFIHKDGGDKKAELELKIKLDTVQIWESRNGSDFLYIDGRTDMPQVSYMSRILNVRFAGVKVCGGVLFTREQVMQFEQGE